MEALKSQLLPLAAVLTPNIPEAEVLSGLTISGPEDMERAAREIGERYGCAVLCKGGHDLNDANDLLWRMGAANGSADAGSITPHPRDRLHALQCHRLQSGEGL